MADILRNMPFFAASVYTSLALDGKLLDLLVAGSLRRLFTILFRGDMS